MSTLNYIFGIDLGTTYSCISYVDEYMKPVVIKNSENERITPSVVFFDEDEVIVGNTAKANSQLSPNNVVSMIKRSMGDPNYIFEHNGNTYRPEEISSFILKKLAIDTKQILNLEVKDVVITVPAYFGVNEREATANAGKIAGLNVRHIINEPTAAAISYGLDRHDQDQVVLVYDLGGGTFDITMLEIKNKEIKVICTGGNHQLGGKDWDNVIVKHLVSEVEKKTGESEESILDDNETLNDLLIEAEKVKKTLTVRKKTNLKITHAGTITKVKLTRKEFNTLTDHLLEKTIDLTNDMLEEAKKKGYHSFDKILLVGGSTRMPQVIEKLEINYSVEIEFHDPDESVACGAALFGHKISISDEVQLKMNNQTEEYEDLDSVSPEIKEKAQEEVAQEFGLMLDKVRTLTDTKVTNVTSKSFGVVITDKKDYKKYVVNLITKNDPVPVETDKTFGTIEDNQDSVELIIMENLISDKDELIELDICTEIGNAVLSLPPGLPENSPIKIFFKLTGDGRLIMKAVEENEGQDVEVTVETEALMSKEQIAEAQSRARSIQVS